MVAIGPWSIEKCLTPSNVWYKQTFKLNFIAMGMHHYNGDKRLLLTNDIIVLKEKFVIFLWIIFFQMLVLIVVGIGILFSLIFHVGVREKATENVSEGNRDSLNDTASIITIERSAMKQVIMSWKCWLKEHQFYQVRICFNFCFFSILKQTEATWWLVSEMFKDPVI